MKTICRTIEKWDESKTTLKAKLTSEPDVWEEVAKFNGSMSAEEVRKAFDNGLSVWTSFSRYVPVCEEVSDGQAAWETAMGMRGYAGSPAQQQDTKPLPAYRNNAYDYENQAWVVDGRYVSCDHPEDMKCGCFGRIHAGESPAANAEIH